MSDAPKIGKVYTYAAVRSVKGTLTTGTRVKVLEFSKDGKAALVKPQDGGETTLVDTRDLS